MRYWRSLQNKGIHGITDQKTRKTDLKKQEKLTPRIFVLM